MKLENNAIELWCEEADKVFKSSVVPMTEKQTMLFINMTFSEEAMDKEKELLEMVESKKAGMLSAFWLRIKFQHTYKITMALAYFISKALIGDNFGIMTMMANYLQWVCHKRHWGRIGISQFCLVFPMGFPGEEQWSRLWSMQKVDREFLPNDGAWRSDNILDYEACGKTIREI